MRKKLIKGFIFFFIITMVFMLSKGVLYNIQLKKDVNNLVNSYNFIYNYELSGYKDSSIEIFVKEQFDDMKFKDKEKVFREIKESLENILLKRNGVKNDNKLNFLYFVKPKVTSNYNGKTYKYDDLGFEVKQVFEKPSKINNLSFKDLEITVTDELKKSYKDIEEIEIKTSTNTKGDEIWEHYNKIIIMKDSFYDISVKEQYLIINDIYKDYQKIIIDAGKDIDSTLWIYKNENQYATYVIDSNIFEIVSYGVEINRYELEENINQLDRFDNKKAANGTYKGQTYTNYSSNLSPSYTIEPTDKEKGVAWYIATEEIKNNLKSPSTAKFPFSYNNQSIKKSLGNKFQVISYVDAENGFGATIRTNFIVEFELISDDSYKLINLSIIE